jgi:hypothetical protein
MNDIYLEWGGDLVAGNGGDLALATGTDTISQRICRRLLTNPGDYLWTLDYGGGLARFVGAPADPAKIEAVVRDQLGLETAVPTHPVPVVKASVVDAANGYLVTKITYNDPASKQPVQLNVTAG